MAGSFFIFLREGIEGSMIVTMMCAYLASVNRRDLFRWVFAGVAAALLAAGAAGVILYIMVAASFVGSDIQTWFETCTFALAVVVLTYMTFWMKKHARGINADLKSQVSRAIAGQSGLALALVAFATVGREALETAIFVLAITFQSSPLALAAGAVAGLAVSLGLSLAMYRMGIRINMKRLFTVVGVALMFVSAGLLANAIQNLQSMGVLPGRDTILWDTGRLVSNQSALGDMLHGLLGYAAAPTVLQVLAWVLFLAIGLPTFFDWPKAVVMRLSARGGSA